MKLKKTIIGLTGILIMTVTTTAIVSCSNNEKKKPQKKIIKTTQLVNESFEFSGKQGSGKLQLKKDVNLPDEIEVKYYKGSKINPLDTDYTSKLNNLGNGEIIKVKFFIKTTNRATHKLPADFINPISLTVSGLDKITVSITNLVASSFELIGTEGSLKGRLKQDINLPDEVEIRYYKGTNPSSDSDYNLVPPNDLKVGDKLQVKFFIKPKYAKTHQFPKKMITTKKTSSEAERTFNKLKTAISGLLGRKDEFINPIVFTIQ